MNRKFALLVALIILLLGTPGVVPAVGRVEAGGTIYIRDTGEVEGTDRIDRDGEVYTLTDHIDDSIVVERDCIVIDGSGHILQGTGGGTGIDLSGRKNVTVTNLNVRSFQNGIYLNGSSMNSISGNNMAWSSNGIVVHSSSNNSISGNNVMSNWNGIQLYLSSKNCISGNDVTANDFKGVYLKSSSSNDIVGNVITSSSNGIVVHSSSNNSISENNVTSNDIGIMLSTSSDNSIGGNNVANNGWGIYLFVSSNNSISINNLSNNRKGIHLVCSSKNVLRGNDMVSNGNNFGVDYVIGAGGLHFDNDIDVSNTVDGKPIYYWIDKSDESVPHDAGYVGLIRCSRIIVQGLDLTKNGQAVLLVQTSNSVITRNMITNNQYGVWILDSSNNSIRENTFSDNYCSIWPWYSSNNSVLHNNFMVNVHDVGSQIGQNKWDDGFEGNYWSGYNGTDSDADGIGDTSYLIDIRNADNFPLMGMFSAFNTSLGEYVKVVSNSTIEDFKYFKANSTIQMYVSNMTTDQTHGFCRVCICSSIMNVSHIQVKINQGATPILHHNYSVRNNGTHRWIYFAYEHSTQEIDILTEFPSLPILPLFMAATLLVALVYRRKHCV